MSKTLVKFEFQSAIGSSSRRIQFGQSHHAPPRIRPTVGRKQSMAPPVSPRALLQSPCTSWTPQGRLRRTLRPPSAPHSRPSSLTRAPPLLGELLHPCHRIPSWATPSSALPRCPLPRRSVSCPSQAPVSPHCSLRREVHLSRVRRDHQQRGQTSVVHLWPWFFFLQLPLASLLLVLNLYWVAMAPVRRRIAVQRRRSVIFDSEHPRS